MKNRTERTCIGGEFNGGLSTHQPSQKSVAGTREHEHVKGKGERGNEGKLIIAGGYWWLHNHLPLESRTKRNDLGGLDTVLTLGYATRKSDNEHRERCEWVKCGVVWRGWNKCVLDVSARWGMATRVRKDWGTSLQTAPRGQLLTMRSQYKECVS